MYEEVDKRFDEKFKHITNIGVQCDLTTLVNIKQFIHKELDCQREDLLDEEKIRKILSSVRRDLMLNAETEGKTSLSSQEVDGAQAKAIINQLRGDK